MATYFISETYLKESTPIGQTVDMSELNPHINSAEQMFIKPILGSKLFSTLKIAYSGQSLSTDEITLVDLIKIALAWRVYSESLIYIKSKTKPSGVVNLHGEHFANTEFKEMQQLKEDSKNRAEHYEQAIVIYLQNYSNLYPDYTTPDTKDVIPNRNTSYSSPIFIPSLNNNNGKIQEFLN